MVRFDENSGKIKWGVIFLLDPGLSRQESESLEMYKNRMITSFGLSLIETSGELKEFVRVGGSLFPTSLIGTLGGRVYKPRLGSLMTSLK